jgi:hypothetical protein
MENQMNLLKMKYVFNYSVEIKIYGNNHLDPLVFENRLFWGDVFKLHQHCKSYNLSDFSALLAKES